MATSPPAIKMTQQQLEFLANWSLAIAKRRVVEMLEKQNREEEQQPLKHAANE
jgi:hypothetical protein